MGENDVAPWTQEIERWIPQITINNRAQDASNHLTRTVIKGSVLDHMGIPTQNSWSYAASDANKKEISISSLPTKAYALIWSEFFRDENLQNPLYITRGDGNQNLINKYHSAYVSDPDAAQVSYAQYGGLPCLKVCKPHDYFTSCLPGAQKGPAVRMPFAENEVPVNAKVWNDADANPSWSTEIGTTLGPSVATWIAASSGAANGLGEIKTGGEEDKEFMPDDPEIAEYWTTSDNQKNYHQLYVDMSNAVGATINQLRQAFAIQKFYERDARGGTRYIESIWAHFRVRNPDYRLQRPEYLGGFRQNINMNQVIQNSPLVEGSTPLGTTGAYSVTSHQDNDVFSHSFTEHGILMGLCCIRTEHTYQQGINRSWFKKKRLDFYTPEFANLGEQAVLNQEIYVQGTSEDTEAFGYQEAWAEMRYMPSTVSGEMRSDYSSSLDIWHYADEYDSKPELGDKWIQETDANVARTLAVQDHDQFMFDFYFGAIYTRPLPLYSVPGLIDHH